MRRLQVLAQAGDAAVWAMRPATALRESSPAVLRLMLAPLPGNELSIVFHKRRGPVREAPLRLRLEGMEGARRNGGHAMPAPLVSPVVAGGSAHAVLDRGASAAPVAGRAAAELA
ncbi:hypothetical protein AWV79_08685 [Cupriavidus sp. UYMMa02A]|nr:hypothetical protein AWV79_08685 [Cupriavidus sp. UYMMa02A]